MASGAVMIELQDYRLTTKIYESASTLVYRGFRREDQHPVVGKMSATVHPSPGELVQLAHEHELTVLAQEGGGCRFYGTLQHESRTIILLEDIGGCSLDGFLGQALLPLSAVLDISIALVEAVVACHAKELLHQAIRPSNILWNPKSKQLRLIDFGVATTTRESTRSAQWHRIDAQSLPYLAPEQTGRIGGQIDTRTDLYNLGMTLYELMTGATAFQCKEIMEWFQCHLAKSAPLAHHRRDELPEPLSQIVAKLIAKSRRDRYQSAYGVLCDLQRCRDMWEQRQQMETFVLGRDDLQQQLQSAQQLYGRNQPLAQLEALLALAAEGTPVFCLIEGQAGLGKTSLVEALGPAVVACGGYLLKGKSDLQEKDTPYAPLLGALKELLHCLLQESEVEIRAWKDRISRTIGELGQSLYDALPELSALFGHHFKPLALPMNEAQNRFLREFTHLILACAGGERPLVLFLDDMQWIDVPSLRIMERLLRESAHHKLMVIGAIRPEEAEQNEALQAFLREKPPTVEWLRLAPLSREDIQQWLAEIFQSSVGRTLDLAAVCWDKTRGNPFFLQHLLRSLWHQDVIHFARREGVWNWSLSQIAQHESMDNVISWMLVQLRQLPRETTDVLSVAACFGGRFSAQLLARYFERPLASIQRALQPAIEQGLLIFRAADDWPASADVWPQQLAFAHDRIGQAARALVSKKDVAQIHLDIARVYLREFSDDELLSECFHLMNHFERGREYLKDDQEREIYLRWCLVAAQRAQRTAAYESALRLSEGGIALLGSAGWKSAYEVMLRCHDIALEAAYFLLDFDRMTRWCEEVELHATALLDKVKSYEVRLHAFTAQQRSWEALQFALPMLQKLGVQLPLKPHKGHIAWGLLKIKFALMRHSSASLAALPPMSDPEKLAAMHLLTRASLDFAAFNAMPALYPLMVFEQLRLSLAYGNTADSAVAYASYGMISCGFLGEIQQGHEYGLLALSVVDTHGGGDLSPKIQVLYNGFLQHYRHPLKASLEPLQQALARGLQTGYFDATAGAALTYIYNAFFAGTSLEQLSQEIPDLLDTMRYTKQEVHHNYARQYQQAIHNLRRGIGTPALLHGDHYDEDAELPKMVHNKDGSGLFCAYYLKAMLAYFFGEYDVALVNSSAAYKHRESGLATIGFTTFLFQDAMICLALYPSRVGRARRSLLRRVRRNQKLLKPLAEHAPNNYQAKFALVEAERAMVLSQPGQALRHFNEALALSRQHRHVLDEAWICHRMAAFYQQAQQPRVTRLYALDAIHCAQRWGAQHWAQHLHDLYEHVITDPMYRESAPALDSSSSASVASLSQTLDLQTVYQTAWLLVQERQLERLMTLVLQAVLENAGATRGVLLFQQEETWWMQLSHAQSTSSGGLDERSMAAVDLLALSPEEAPFATSLIHYVLRTGRALLLNQADELRRFAGDPYLERGQVRSVLCLPCIQGTKCLGLLYLEHSLTEGAFSEDRVQLLQLLATQATVALESASLYLSMENRVQTQTAALQAALQQQRDTLSQLHQQHILLKDTQAHLVHSEKMAGLGNLVKGLTHEFKNPLQFIHLGAQNIEQELKILFALLMELAVDENDAVDPDFQRMMDGHFGKLSRNLGPVYDGVRRVSDMVDALKQFSRLDEAEWKRVDIITGLKATVALIEPGFREVVTCRIEANATPLLWCWPAQLNQVFSALLRNACEAILRREQPDKPGVVCIDVRVEGEHLSIAFRDNGVGFPDAERDRLFEPFYTTKQPGEGAGLGLSIAYGVITKHNGTLTLAPNQSTGASATVRLPVSGSPTPPIVPQSLQVRPKPA